MYKIIYSQKKKPSDFKTKYASTKGKPEWKIKLYLQYFPRNPKSVFLNWRFSRCIRVVSLISFLVVYINPTELTLDPHTDKRLREKNVEEAKDQTRKERVGMASKMTMTNNPPPPRVYVEFKPKVEISEDGTTITIHLPGFKREQLKVQHIKATTPHKLRITGERHIDGDKWLAIEEEFLVSPDCDTGKIAAVFQNGILSVKQPKKMASVKQQEERKEQRESAQEQGKGQTKIISQGSTKAAPESSKLQETRKEPNTKAEERESSKPATPQVKGKDVSEEAPKLEESKSHTRQAKPNDDLKDEKSETGRSSDEAKSSSVAEEGTTSKTTTDNKNEEGITKNTAKREGYDGTCLEMNLRRHGKTLNLALVVLAVIGIGLYVKNIYDY